MLRSVLVSVIALTVGGCATISKQTAFDAINGGAFALVAGDGMRINGSESYSCQLQRVDGAAGNIVVVPVGHVRDRAPTDIETLQSAMMSLAEGRVFV